MAALQQRSQGPTQISTTQTATQSQTRTQSVLRLRGAHAPSRRSVQWAEDVVDNEGLGRKSSKVCCIYHKPKAVDESSDESSSSSSSDSDSEADQPRRVSSGDRNGKKHTHDCANHDHDHGHGHGRSRRRKGGDDQGKRAPSPNAYERVPKPSKPKDNAGEGSKGGKAKA